MNADDLGRAAHAAWKAWRISVGYPDHPFKLHGYHTDSTRPVEKYHFRTCTCGAEEDAHHTDMVPWEKLPAPKRVKYIVQGQAAVRLLAERCLETFQVSDWSSWKDPQAAMALRGDLEEALA